MKGTKVDPFYDLIFHDEIARAGIGGFIPSFNTASIALPPLLLHGSQMLKDMICRDVVVGNKTMSLCVTEPQGGSDVASLRTTARYSASTREYVITGSKKWITGGMKADFFMVVAKTEGCPANQNVQGLSMFVIPGEFAGITRRRMKTQGWWDRTQRG